MCETAGATQHQLEVTSRELQPKLQAAMQQAYQTLVSGVSRIQEVCENPRLHALQQSIMSAPSELSPGTFIIKLVEQTLSMSNCERCGCLSLHVCISTQVPWLLLHIWPQISALPIAALYAFC